MHASGSFQQHSSSPPSSSSSASHPTFLQQGGTKSASSQRVMIGGVAGGYNSSAFFSVDPHAGRQDAHVHHSSNPFSAGAGSADLRTRSSSFASHLLPASGRGDPGTLQGGGRGLGGEDKGGGGGVVGGLNPFSLHTEDHSDGRRGPSSHNPFKA